MNLAHSPFHSALLIVAAIACAAGNFAPAQTAGPGSPSQQLVETDRETIDRSEIEGILEALHAPRFSERLQASRRLQQFGTKAHPALREISLHGEPDSATRALDLLRSAAKSPNRAIADSARMTLREIAESESPRAPTAEHALEDARPQKTSPQVPALRPVPAPRPFPPLLPNAANPIQPPVIRPFAPRGGAANLRIRIKVINGTREIDVTRNNERFRFKDTEGGLLVERPDGKGGVRTKTYKNSAELKSIDFEAYDAYQKAGGTRAGGGIRFRRPNERFNEQPNDPTERQQQGPRIELRPGIIPQPNESRRLGTEV